jgi:hypothetical protein
VLFGARARSAMWALANARAAGIDAAGRVVTARVAKKRVYA